jgi:hypothetical protein
MFIPILNCFSGLVKMPFGELKVFAVGPIECEFVRMVGLRVQGLR